MDRIKWQKSDQLQMAEAKYAERYPEIAQKLAQLQEALDADLITQQEYDQSANELRKGFNMARRRVNNGIAHEEQDLSASSEEEDLEEAEAPKQHDIKDIEAANDNGTQEAEIEPDIICPSKHSSNLADGGSPARNIEYGYGGLKGVEVSSITSAVVRALNLVTESSAGHIV